MWLKPKNAFVRVEKGENAFFFKTLFLYGILKVAILWERVFKKTPIVFDVLFRRWYDRFILYVKLGRSLLKENKTGCNMAFTKLGKLAAHLNPRVLEEEKYIPVNIEENFMEDCPQIDIELKKSQVYWI